MKINKNSQFFIGIIFILLLIVVISFTLAQRSDISPEDSSANTTQDPLAAAVCGQTCTLDFECQGIGSCGSQSLCMRSADSKTSICIPDSKCWNTSCGQDSDCVKACGTNGVCRSTESGGKCFYNNSGVLINEIHEVTE